MTKIQIIRAAKTGLLATFLLGCLNVKADQFRYLKNGLQSYGEILSAVRSAEKSIDIATYILEPCDQSSKILLQALATKAKHHVQVRVLVDAHTLSLDRKAELAAFFEKNRIQFRVYNQGILPGLTGNHRTHIKMIQVDGKVLITGGRNLSDDYFGFSQNINYIDRDMIAFGQVAKQAASLYSRFWNTQLSKSTYSASAEKLARFESSCLALNSRSNEILNYLASNQTKIQQATKLHTCKSSGFYLDQPEFLDKSPEAFENGDLSAYQMNLKESTSAFVQFLNQTKEYLTIENWSYIPALQVDTAFADLRARNVQINIFTNQQAEAEGSFNIPFDKITHYYANHDTSGSQSVYRLSRYGQMNDRHQFTPSTGTWRIHSKIAVKDHQDIAIGSFNIDPRSYHTNLESLLLIDNCAELATEVEQQSLKFFSVINSDQNCSRCQSDELTAADSWSIAWFAREFL